LALTGWGTEEDRAKTRESGFDRHFTKPVAPDEIRRFLDGMGR
jgi:DNA-binding response OmpR family regulator